MSLPPSCVAFFIDADNLNEPDAVMEAFEQLHAIAGPSTVRRAYGAADSLKGIARAMKVYAVRPCANFALDKSTTDVALVVDVMELACTATAPAVIAIGSGDADFFPLVARLRERGVRVIGFSLHGKMSEEMKPVYPELFLVGRPRSGAMVESPAPAGSAAPTALAPTPARKTAARKSTTPAVVPVPAEGKAAPARTTAPSPRSTPASKPAAKKRGTSAMGTNGTPAAALPPPPATRKTAARKTTAASSASRGAAVPPTLERILAVLPMLRSGQAVHISEASNALHAAAVIGKNASCTKLFGRFPNDFELTPAGQPNRVRWIPR